MGEWRIVLTTPGSQSGGGTPIACLGSARVQVGRGVWESWVYVYVSGCGVWDIASQQGELLCVGGKFYGGGVERAGKWG